MNTDNHVRIVFAVGLVLLGMYALYLNKDVAAAVCIGAVAGVFTMKPGTQSPN